MNIYQIFVRNLTQEGTFKAATQDLHRIAQMGFEVIYLMPFQPISKLNRKGTYGSPYAIADYYGVSEDLGTHDEVKTFLETAHQLGLKVIMDIVFNHAGADHVWTKTHPHFFLLDEQGNPTRKVADWYDIVDYNFDEIELYTELKKVLMFWAEFGFDGFRCDVASLVPFSFWLEAISLVCGHYPHIKWYSESIDHKFLKALRLQGESVMSDMDILRMFDGSYDYDIWPLQLEVMFDHSKMETYVEVLNYRYALQLKNKVKWHFVENHDQVRMREKGLSDRDYKNWLAFSLFQQGMGFVYQGMESKSQPHASFFEKEVINRDFDESLISLMTKINQIKKEIVQQPILWQEFSYQKESLITEITVSEFVYTLYCHFGTHGPVLHDKIVEQDSIVITKRKRV